MNQVTIPRWLVIGVLPSIVLLFFLTASAHFGYTTDDTYIYLQFAKNVVQGNGISFNAGEPTYGFTSPLWLALIALGGKMGIDVYIAAKVLDLLFASLAIMVFYFFAFEVIRDVVVGLLATIAFSVNVWLLRWAGTGMETSLAVLLLLLTLFYCLRNEYLLSIIFSALLTYVRPESCVIVGFIFIDLMINSVDRRRAFRKIIALGSMYVLTIVPWLVYAYSTFGTIVPNTARAKSDMQWNIDEMTKGFLDIGKIVVASEGIAIVVLVVAGILLIKNMRRSSIDKEEKYFLFRQSFVSIAWIVTLPLIYGFTRTNVVSRYLLLATPLIGVFAFGYLFRYLISAKTVRTAFTAVIVLTVAIVLQNQLTYWIVVKPGIDAFEEGMDSTLIPIGKWLNENTQPDDVVFVWDIGAMGYYSNRKMCDGSGLATPGMIPLMHAGFGPEKMMQEQIYHAACQADYVVCRSYEPEQWKVLPDLIPVLTKPFYRLGLLKERMYYYTVYKVNSPFKQN